jgi:glutaminyl-tRNA synthetase
MNFIEDKIVEKKNLDKLKLRFPPEPNGYLHIGHAKSICLNFGLAEKFNRPCNLRFDDTNPSTEDTHFVESIKKDIEWLGFKWDGDPKYTSEYFEFIYECAIKLIKKGLAYVDDSTSEEIATLKGTPLLAGSPSPYYSRTIEENLDLFNRMKNGEFAEGSKILRAKIDMASPNMILRDPVMYRIINKSHHHVGDVWKIYPMYDFAHPLSDYIEGITDSLCTLEFEVHRPLYNWFLEKLEFDNVPEETEFARLNIDYTILSKRKLKKLVEDKLVFGWDDPRMPTISGLRRRGYIPEAIKDFCEAISVTKKDTVISHLLLEECLRNRLNKSTNRLMGVMDPIKITITNWNKGTEMVEVENNPEDLSTGKRMIPFSGEIWIEREDFREDADNKFFRLKPNCEVRLKGAYVIKANEIIKDGDNIIEIKCTYDPLSKSGMVLDRKVKGVIHWVSIAHGINAEVMEYSLLFNDPTPDKSDDFINLINSNSLIINYNAVFEPSVIDTKPGVPVQMMRKGYYVRDTSSNKLIFNKTVSLKEDKYKN